MFCSQCGQHAAGNFCCHCGAKLAVVDSAPQADPAAGQLVPTLYVPAELVEADWSDEIRYDVLIAHAEVRSRIADAARRHREKITGEEILALLDAVASPPVSMEKLGRALLPVYSKLGIRTGKSASQVLSLPPGRVLLAVLCSLASQGITVKQVEQALDACTLTCSVPSNVWSMSGEVTVAIRRLATRTLIDAHVTIPGQLYDWGKSRTILDHLLSGTTAFAA
jgi:hypothetical protein